MSITLRGLLLAASCLAGHAAWAAPGERVRQLIEAQTAPPGVVFEVVSGNEAQLEQVLPAIRVHAQRLRVRYPGLPIAVLTHGSEQFSLLRDNTGRYAGVHELVSALGRDEDIAVQVCGNHASWRDKGPADFADDVEVVSSAGSKLAEYREAGYVIIVM